MARGCDLRTVNDNPRVVIFRAPADVDLITTLRGVADALSRRPGFQAQARERALQAFLANRDANLFFGVHASWEEASAQAQAYGRAGYDNEAGASLYDHRTRIDMHDYPALAWLLRSMHEGHRGVLDLGGSIGIKFLAFREALAPWPDLTWTVHDVPAAMARGRELAAQRGDSQRLRFAERFDDAQGCDVLLASGVLQYLPSTLGQMLAGWQRLPRRIVINTAAVHPQHEFFTVNSIGTAFCPYRVQTQASLIRGLTSLGYRLREAWINPDKPLTIPLDEAHSLRHYSGYCLDLAA